MAGLKIRAFSGFEPGWSTAGTNAAFIVSVLRYNYGDEFDYAALQDFKRGNRIEEWTPRADLLADGTLIGKGDGKIYIPEGFDTTGWDEIYAAWKAGRSQATAPRAPAPPVIEYYDEDDDDEFDVFETTAIPSVNPPPPSSIPPLPPEQPISTAAPVKPSPTQAVINAAPSAAAVAKKNETDYMPWLLAAAGIGAYFYFSNKKGRRK